MRTRAQGVVLLMIAALALSGCAYGGLLESEDDPSAKAPLMMVDPQATPRGVVTYLTMRGTPAGGSSTAGGVEVKADADTRRLHKAPEAFRAFIGEQLAANGLSALHELNVQRVKKKVRRECRRAPARITVWGVGTAVATGRESWCNRESDEIIWTRSRGEWRAAARMHGGWDCSVLDRYRVPADITAAVCWEDDGVTEREYDGP